MIIENAWNEYKNKCIMDDANIYQLKVMRIAFFAGFAVMLRFARLAIHLDCKVLDAEVEQASKEMEVLQ